jgi:hypothetical protein
MGTRRRSALILFGLAVLWTAVVAAAYQNAPRPGILISDPTGAIGIHYLIDKNILFLMPSLPDTFQVCTAVTAGGGYTNCRSMQALRFPVK